MVFDVSKTIFGVGYKICENCSYNAASDKQWCNGCSRNHHFCRSCFISIKEYQEETGIMAYDFEQNEYNPDLLETLK